MTSRQILYILFFAAIIVVEGHKRGGRIPPNERAPYLRGLNTTITDEYHKIVGNPNLTKKQFRDAVDTFASTLPPENKKLYSEWKSRHESKAKQLTDEFHTKIASLSAEAQNLAKQMKSIHDNLDITRAAEKEQIHKIRSSASESVRKELKGILPFHGRHGKKERKN
uniref:SXP/RAL-2 family protein Ani s 5-like cation-binding domain-containing protein n=1 Tax=Panagrolaimus davidi TaxID=227884 RepID=A0A914P2X3_9BILA